MSLTTQQVTGASYAATDSHPSTFVVPGAASVTVEGAPVYADAAAAAAGAEPVATLPLETRVRVDENLGSVNGGPQLLAIHTLDGATGGVMAAASLTPRDSQGPRVWDADAGTGAFSPNGDGSQDEYLLEVALSEAADWTLRIRDGDTTLASATGTGTTAAIAWDGRHDGSTVQDGDYTWHLEAADGWGNAPLLDDGRLHVDTVAPTLDGGGLSAAEAGPVVTFSPNGDGTRDTMSVGVGADEPSTIEAVVRNGSGSAVADIGAAAPSGSATLTWNGRSDGGALMLDGLYTLAVRARDAAGNRSSEVTSTIGVHKALHSARTSTVNFYPNDKDTYGNSLTLAFDLLATQTVTWRIVDANGVTVRTLKENAVLGAGRHSVTWSGRSATGAYLPRGLYRSVVTATNGTLTSTLTAPFVQDMFKFSVSDATPGRGQAITVTIVSAEPLSKSPRLTVTQPGISPWAVTLSHVSGRTYKATIRLRSSSTGTVQLRASGYDLKSDYESSLLKLPLH
jgi:flagellar hook assembly protein FlgD